MSTSSSTKSLHIAIDAINDNDRIRGPDRYLIGLLEGLAQCELNARFTIFYAYWQTFYEELKLPNNFSFVRCSPPRHRIKRVLWHAFSFAGIVNKYRPDVVHLPNLIFVLFLRAPVVTTVHDLAHFRYPEKFGYVRGYLQRWLIRGALRLTDKAIAVSEFTRKEMRELLNYPLNKTTVIGEGGPEPVSVPKDETSPAYFLYVGQLERSKNIESLIKAFIQSELFKKENVQLWIAGKSGTAAEIIQVLVASLNSPRIKLLGYVDDEALPELYANAVAFVFPSLIEGFGLVLLEAMAYGTPVIASNASVIPEVVGNAGLVVNALDLNALQDAMELIYQEPEVRQQLIEAGRERLNFFSWREAARQTFMVYEEASRG